ncbi:MAG: DNA-binding protein WhiA, partial [Ruminococcus sp.]
MSFSSDVKKELCLIRCFDRDMLKAELYGMLLFGKSFSQQSIVFTTESSHAVRRAAFLLENLYMPIIERQSALRVRTGESRLYRLSVVGEDDCKRIFEDFGHNGAQVTLRVNRANLSGEECAAAFVRGVYLSCGSVSDPMKSYHAEFCAPHKNLSVDLCKILTEVTECTFTPKTVRRNGSYIVYFKGSEQICDLLTYMGAPIQAMEIMGTKAVKQVRNNVNRRINSEVANITKVASASAKQLEAIKTIKNTVGLEALPDDLKEIAYLRLENPEMSLRTLGENLTPPISRSGANHRMQRLLEYAQSGE